MILKTQMMKKTTMLLIIAGTTLHYGQVGISTTNPKADLHINGKLQITKDLNTGGTATTVGDSGKTNEMLFSQGPGLPPVWRNTEDINVPQEIVFLKKQKSTTSFSANTTSTLSFDIVNLTDAKITLNNTTSPSNFTIKKKGNYQFSIYVRYRVDPSDSSGIATTNFLKNATIIGGQTSGYANGITYIDQNFSYTGKYDVNDIIHITTNYTKSYIIEKASVAIQYLGN